MNNEKIIYKKGTFWERVLALLIDQFILLAIIFVLSFSIPQRDDNTVNLAYWLISIAYGTLFIWKSGRTPGKKLLKLKVVTNRYKTLSLGTALFRESIGKLLSGLFNIGYLWVLLNSKRQAWHDMLARTLVVKTDKNGALIQAVEDEKITNKQKVTFALTFIVLALPFITASLFLIIYIFFAQPFQIAGDAMAPNYVNGQYYLANKIAYMSTEPSRGDVFVFRNPVMQDRDFIKRTIGLPGETVSIYNQKVYINRQLLDESSYLNPEILTYGGSFLQEGQEITVPADQYFVLGDNRPFSSDSREWGFVPKENIIGKIVLCYYNCELSKQYKNSY